MPPRNHLAAFASSLNALTFSAPVAYVYNPLDYARDTAADFRRRYATGTGKILLLGMNPGPWGMAQTGVPFGEVNLVRDWLGIKGKITKPTREHPRRPVMGLDCHRSEVSGRRVWGWARDTFETPERFFEHFFVANYCPLMFLDADARNLTPDKLPAKERTALESLCDRALLNLISQLQPRRIIGIGKYAESRARAALANAGTATTIASIQLATRKSPEPTPSGGAVSQGITQNRDRKEAAVCHCSVSSASRRKQRKTGNQSRDREGAELVHRHANPSPLCKQRIEPNRDCEGAVNHSSAINSNPLQKQTESKNQNRDRKGAATPTQQSQSSPPASFDIPISSIPHPSPANPAANRGWARLVDKQLLPLLAVT